MNNKYDIGNYAKLLEQFNPDTEIQLVSSFLRGTEDSVAYIPEINQPKFDFVKFKTEQQEDLSNLSKELAREPSQSIQEVLTDNSLSLLELDEII